MLLIPLTGLGQMPTYAESRITQWAADGIVGVLTSCAVARGLVRSATVVAREIALPRSQLMPAFPVRRERAQPASLDVLTSAHRSAT